MPEYWVEIHPEPPAYIMLCDKFLEILKHAGFGNELDSKILSTGTTFTIILYKSEYPDKQKSRLVGNHINNIDYSNIRNVYKNTTRIPLAFEQEGKDLGTDFDVFVIDFGEVENNKNEPENLDDVFV